MLSLARLSLPALAGLFLFCSVPAGCGDPDAGAEPTPVDKKSGLPTLPKLDDTAGAPAEPLTFAVAPLVGDTRIDVGVKVADAAGKRVKLKTLLRDPSFLIFGDAAVKGRAPRTTTRVLIRPLARSAAHAGFRVLVLFQKGTSEDEVATWYEKRRIPATVHWAIDDKGEFAAATSWKRRTAALVDTRGTVGELFGPEAGVWDDRVATVPTATSDILARAWQLPDVGPEIDDATVAAATALAVATLRGVASDTAPSPGAAAVSFKAEHDVWVSLFRPGDIVRLRGRSGPGALGPAVEEATRAALASAGDKEAEWRAAPDQIRVQIDVLGAEYPIPTTGEKALWYLMEPGVHGVRLTEGTHEAVLLPSEPKSMGLVTPRVRARKDKHRRIFGGLCKDAGLKADCWNTGSDATLTRFRSTSFGLVEPGKPAVRIFRGNVLWEGDPTEGQVLDSIKFGGRWLVNTVKEDGKFDYEYFPNKDAGSPGYNIVRHAGSVYGLFEMWELAGVEPHMTEDRDLYIGAAGRSMGYVYDGIKPPKMAREGRLCLLDDRGGCDSGSAALTLLTFLARPAPEDVPAEFRDACYRDDDAATMEGLGLTLLDMIDERGWVFRRYTEAITKDEVRKEPLYYPGESMLALVRFYEKTGDVRWLQGAEAIARSQMKNYEKNRMLNPDHWVMQGLYRLWRIGKEDRYAESAYAMGRHYAAEQYGVPGKYGPLWTPWPDYLGSYRRANDLPRTTRAGSRSEALRAVTNLAWERGDDATTYEEALLGAARHLMEQQYTERNGYWLPDLARAHGAYPMGVVDNHIRIDNNQHALVGVVGALHVIRRRAAN